MKPFEQLRNIVDKIHLVGTEKSYARQDVLNLLYNSGIKLRNKDGDLKIVTISTPTSETDCYVIGLRYKKKDMTYTEDCFIVRKGRQKITAHYKGDIETIFPEYKGTHKEQLK